MRIPGYRPVPEPFPHTPPKVDPKLTQAIGQLRAAQAVAADGSNAPRTVTPQRLSEGVAAAIDGYKLLTQAKPTSPFQRVDAAKVAADLALEYLVRGVRAAGERDSERQPAPEHLVLEVRAFSRKAFDQLETALEALDND